MWKCNNCKVAGTGFAWHLNQYDVPILTDRYIDYPIVCNRCGSDLQPVSAIGAEKSGYEIVGWLCSPAPD